MSDPIDWESLSPEQFARAEYVFRNRDLPARIRELGDAAPLLSTVMDDGPAFYDLCERFGVPTAASDRRAYEARERARKLQEDEAEIARRKAERLRR